MDSANIKNITLQWTDLKTISDLTMNDQTEGGVYLWGFSVDTVFVPYYIGIADNIIFRIYKHINSIIGGHYTIFHHNSLANFKDFKDRNVQMDKSKGKIYLPDWPHGYKHFIDIRKVLQPHIDFMVDSFTFSFATVDKQVVSGNDLKEIEKICINQIGKENLANTRAGHSDKFIIDHKGHWTVTEKFKSNKPLTAGLRNAG